MNIIKNFVKDSTVAEAIKRCFGSEYKKFLSGSGFQEEINQLTVGEFKRLFISFEPFHYPPEPWWNLNERSYDKHINDRDTDDKKKNLWRFAREQSRETFNGKEESFTSLERKLYLFARFNQCNEKQNPLTLSEEEVMCLCVSSVQEIILNEAFSLVFNNDVLINFLISDVFLRFLRKVDIRFAFELLKVTINEGKLPSSAFIRKIGDEIVREKFVENTNFLEFFQQINKKKKKKILGQGRRDFNEKITEEVIRVYEQSTREFIWDIEMSSWKIRLTEELGKDKSLKSELKNLLEDSSIHFLMEHHPFVLRSLFSELTVAKIKTILEKNVIEILRRVSVERFTYFKVYDMIIKQAVIEKVGENG